jgi:hypothetical protein
MSQLFDIFYITANVGGSATVGWGGASGSVSYGQTDVKSDYASVNEQSGIQAGDGGFQINVANNTDLRGGLISSDQSAIENNKNSLTTATLTTNDINNHADYKASSVSVSVGSDAGGVNIAGAGAGFDKGSASGSTKSAISSANVTITDDAKQLSLTGQTAQETIASINTDTTNANQNITPIFDASKVTGEVEATAQIMQSFTQYAPKAVADYSSAKASELRKEGKEEEAKKWDEGGAYRVATHTIVGGLAGDIAGALGAGVSAQTVPAIGEMINSTDLPSEVKQTLVALAGTAIGAAAGATTGDGGALTGGATGYAQTVNNYLNTVKMADGTYKVVGGKQNNDTNIYDENGKVIGKMLTPYTGFNEEGQAETGAILNLNDQSGVKFLNEHINESNPFFYFLLAQSGFPYDFKSQSPLNDNTVDQRNNRSMPINGTVFVPYYSEIPVIATARDIGNLSAGYVAGENGFSWQWTRTLFDGYNSASKPNGQKIEQPVSQIPQQIGWGLGNQNLSDKIKYNQSLENGTTLPSKQNFSGLK